MRFTKMHGLGNDYVYVDCFHEKTPLDPSALAVRISDRRRGVGSDGLILIEPSRRADAAMRIFNADGSEAGMCGNGIRCVGKYLYDADIRRKDTLFIDTKTGVKRLDMLLDGAVATGARVDMGEPVFDAAKIPVLAESATAAALPIDADGRHFLATCVSMGNPHAVLFGDALPDDDAFGKYGPLIEAHRLFPDRVNVEFCRVDARDRIAVRVWERGSGETMACGTGACAVLVAAFVRGLTDRRTTVTLPGGALAIEWNEEDGHVYMTGPAETAFTGVWPDDAPSARV